MSNEPEKFCKAPFKTAVIDTDGTLLPCCEYMSYKSKLTPYKLNADDTWMFKQWWEKGCVQDIIIDLRKKSKT